MATLDGNTLGVWRAADIEPDGRPRAMPVIAGTAFRLLVSTPAGVAWPMVLIESLQTRSAPTGPDEGAWQVTPGETVMALLEPGRELFLRVPGWWWRAGEVPAGGCP